MRHLLPFVSLIALSACGGGGPQTVSASPPPGSGGSSGSTHSFVAPIEKKTYSAIGGVQVYRYSTDELTLSQYNQLYAGEASTARNSGITISYDPRDAVFELVVSEPTISVSDNVRFQDPAHRTDFGGAVEPQDGTPNILGRGIQYLEADSGSTGPLIFDGAQSDTFPIGAVDSRRDVSTFFYQKPGTTTKYVTYAGFVRNATAIVEQENGLPPRQDHSLEHGAFVFGERTSNSAVPRIGSATYSGDMLATMVFNPLIDDGVSDTYFQWIVGSATTSINFAANSFTTSLAGTVTAPGFDIYSSRTHVLQSGASFAASGSGTIDLVTKGGFTGQVASASFTQNGSNIPVNIVGSSIDGAFFGPKAEEVGGGFRIVGGTPDERIDILGSFVGK